MYGAEVTKKLLDKVELGRKLSAKLPGNLEPYVDLHGEIYCNSGSQIAKLACDAVDAVPEN